MNDYNSVTVSANVSDVNIVSQTLGKIASGAKYFSTTLQSSCATANKYIGLNSYLDVCNNTMVSNYPIYGSGNVTLDGDTFDIIRDGTMTVVRITVNGIEY